VGTTADGALPILVAERGDEAARAMLRAVAHGGGVLVVQLLAAPMVLGPHVLEVRTPGGAPERFLAEPVAAPCDLGFPLRLAPYPERAPLRPSQQPGLSLDSVPDLALDTLPPRRTDAPSSAGGSRPPVEAPLPSLDGWLMPGSSSLQIVGERPIDQAWLAELARMDDVDALREETTALLPAVGRALRDGDAPTLSAVITTMRSIVRQDPQARRAKQAGRVLRFLRDASRLVAFVDAALGGVEEPSAPLKHVLLETQAAAAEALCAGRLRHGGPAVRGRFVMLVRAIGPAAMASVTATLRDRIARGERGGDVVDDLLCAIPPVADEATGMLVAELLRGSLAPSTTTAALAILPGLLGARAQPLVLGALGHPDPRVVLTAIRGLRQLRAIDAAAARWLDAIAAGLTQAPDELRAEATAALREARNEGPR
jgi:hypothetical protein